MSRTRLNLFIEHEHAKRLDELALTLVKSGQFNRMAPDSFDNANQPLVTHRLNGYKATDTGLLQSLAICHPDGYARRFNASNFAQ